MVRRFTEPYRERTNRRGLRGGQRAGEGDRDAHVHDGGPGQNGHEGHRAADCPGPNAQEGQQGPDYRATDTDPGRAP